MLGFAPRFPSGEGFSTSLRSFEPGRSADSMMESGMDSGISRASSATPPESFGEATVQERSGSPPFLAHLKLTVKAARLPRELAELRVEGMRVQAEVDGDYGFKIKADKNCAVESLPGGPRVICLRQKVQHYVINRSDTVVTINVKTKSSRFAKGVKKGVDGLGHAGTLLKVIGAPFKALFKPLVKPKSTAVARIPIAELTTGNTEKWYPLRLLHERFLVRRGIKNAPENDIEILVSLEYEYMRGTKDLGQWFGPNEFVFKSGEVKTVKALVQSLSEANHNLCSHDNIYVLQSGYCLVTLYVRKNGSVKVLLTTDEAPKIHGVFSYGALRPAAKKHVGVWATERDIPGDWKYLGCHRTDEAGDMWVNLPQDYACKPGHYGATAVVASDHTTGFGSVFVLKCGTKCVIFDLDGTINVGDEMMVNEMVLDAFGRSRDFDATMQRHALTVVRMWAAKGYLPIYLSGRQGSWYNLTMEWLKRHNFPPGPLVLTRSRMAALPGKGRIGSYKFVAEFKITFIRSLVARGLDVYAAYGNTSSDVDSYARSGIAPERTFIIGSRGGWHQTVKISNWTDHLEDLWKFEDSPIPTPWHSLYF